MMFRFRFLGEPVFRFLGFSEFGRKHNRGLRAIGMPKSLF